MPVDQVMGSELIFLACIFHSLFPPYTGNSGQENPPQHGNMKGQLGKESGVFQTASKE